MLYSHKSVFIPCSQSRVNGELTKLISDVNVEMATSEALPMLRMGATYIFVK